LPERRYIVKADEHGNEFLERESGAKGGEVH